LQNQSVPLSKLAEAEKTKKQLLKLYSNNRRLSAIVLFSLLLFQGENIWKN